MQNSKCYRNIPFTFSRSKLHAPTKVILAFYKSKAVHHTEEWSKGHPTTERKYIQDKCWCNKFKSGYAPSPRTTSLCSHIFSGPQGSWSVHVCCLHLKMEFRSFTRGRQWCGIIHFYWWIASIKPRLLFSRAGYAYWGLSLSSVFYCYIIYL